MINTIVLCTTLLLITLVMVVIIRAIISHIKVIGRPPVHTYLFILAKGLVMVNLLFLLLKGLKINVFRLFEPVWSVELIAVLILLTGTLILIFTTIQLNKDLIFGLSETQTHKLQTNGIYSISRHPFYLGFIFILFSSCLLYPNPVNIIAFLGAWIIHHLIMIQEEKFLEKVYGEEYRQYKHRVKRYLTLKFR
jgi:protein-S-isoprenylcysteine O-methyltransferase Ste14